jgi:hypothetical protein
VDPVGLHPPLSELKKRVTKTAAVYASEFMTDAIAVCGISVYVLSFSTEIK